MAYLNLVGGQDDQVFDGGSFVINSDGALALALPQFEECIAHVKFENTGDGWHALKAKRALSTTPLEQDYSAMVLSLRDYVLKTGFSSVILGLSGGIDSAIVAVIATDALGPKNVHCVMMPSEYTSQNSLDDAAAVADVLGVTLRTVPIEIPRSSINEVLGEDFFSKNPGLAEENIQSRLRGLLINGSFKQAWPYVAYNW